MAFLFKGVIFDVTQILGLIFLSYLNDINSYSGNASLPSTLMFIFLRDLNLKLTISRKKVIGLSFVLVLILRLSVGFFFLG